MTAPAPLRPAWKVAVFAFLITLALGIAVGAAGLFASNGDRDAFTAGQQFGRALAPFIVIVTIAAYMIQRSRIAQRQPG